MTPINYKITTNISWAQTTRELEDTFSKWGVTNWETNYPRGARLSGYHQEPEDRTVRLSYQKNGSNVLLTMSKQDRAVDNLRVLYLAVEAMRMNEKRGIGEVVQEAYAQLAAPRDLSDPYQILGIREDASLEVAEAAFRARARAAHPDSGGSMEEMKILNETIKQIRSAHADQKSSR